MSKIISWNLQLSVREGRIDDARTLMQDMVRSTRAESGAIAYEWYLSADGTSCHLVERYADSAAVIEHVGNFGSKFADRFLSCFAPTSFLVYGDPNAEARAALDGLGAAYLGWFGGFTSEDRG